MSGQEESVEGGGDYSEEIGDYSEEIEESGDYSEETEDSDDEDNDHVTGFEDYSGSGEVESFPNEFGEEEHLLGSGGIIEDDDIAYAPEIDSVESLNEGSLVKESSAGLDDAQGARYRDAVGRLVCPTLECQNRCSHGRTLDSRGCLTCQCRIVQCPELLCSSVIRCDFGQEKDENGCDTCNCVAGESIRSYEAGEKRIARTVIGEYPQTMNNFAGEDAFFEAESPKPIEEEVHRDPVSDMAQPALVFSCPPLECDNKCPAGRILNEKGCQTCKCNPESNAVGQSSINCSELTCVNNCATERLLDKNGCMTCECLKECPDLECGEGCVKLVVDDKCPICSCEEPCLPLDCGDLKCANGYKRNDRGCEVCECACPEVKCWDGPCQYGSKLANDGCETCECLRPKRPVMACPFLYCTDGPCRQGWWPDRNGCASCQCKKHELVNCTTKHCENKCETYVHDDQDCQTCECEKSPTLECPLLTCDLECVEYRVDSSGCEQCACACPELECEEECSGGYVLDESGCSTCACQSDIVYDLPEFDDSEVGNSTNKVADDFTALSLRSSCSEQPVCWDGPCVYGSVPDLNDCETCICVTSENHVCGPLKCPAPCEFGSYFDRHGCETCNCKPNPASNCPDLSSCSLRCANGFKESDRGCKICECFVLVPPPVLCAKIACDTPCEYSYKTDSRGCRTCECGCGAPQCWDGPCLHGSELDSNGCETCNCTRPSNPVISCGLLDCRGRHCPNGYRKDRHGCYTCQCETETEISSLIPKQNENCTVDLELCPFACMYGNVEVNGCLTCECKTAVVSEVGPSCPLLDCDPCEFGYVEDDKGCRTCQCKARVQELKCVKDCAEICHYSYQSEKDDNGCLHCKCLKTNVKELDEKLEHFWKSRKLLV